MASTTIYLTHDDYTYMQDNKLSGSELLKKAIIMHKEGEIRQDKFYADEILRLKTIISKLQNTITSVGNEVK